LLHVSVTINHHQAGISVHGHDMLGVNDFYCCIVHVAITAVCSNSCTYTL